MQRRSSILLALCLVIMVVQAGPSDVPRAALASSPKQSRAQAEGLPPSSTTPIATASTCEGQEKRYLSGVLLANQRGQVTNRSEQCAFTVGLAAYRMFDDSLAEQQLFDWQTISVAPGQTVELSIDLPECMAQVDLFYGPVLFTFEKERYGERLLAAKKVQRGAFCRPPAPTCALFAAKALTSDDTQLLTIDLRTRRARALGNALDGAALTGLAMRSSTGDLYAISGEQGSRPGHLQRVDTQTGILTGIGDSGYRDLRGLAFRSTDETLWSWAWGVGLIQLDPISGIGSLVYASDLEPQALAWDSTGTRLYAAVGSALWAYDPGADSFSQIVTGAPVAPTALEARPDGLLLGVVPSSKDLRIFAYDVENEQLRMDLRVPGEHGPILAIAWPQSCGNASPGGEAEMIRGVTLSKTEVCPGESLFVQVVAEHPEGPKNDVALYIDGAWGSQRYLQFAGRPGPRTVLVTAMTAERYVDSAERTIEVVDCGASAQVPILLVQHSRYHDRSVEFLVTNAAAYSAQQPRYVWDFGDGERIETNGPFVSHVYDAASGRDQLHSLFDARVTVRRQGQPDVSAQKTLTLWNLYAFDKQRGLLQPPVTTDGSLRREGERVLGRYEIRNLEDEPLEFTTRQLEYQPCDPGRHIAVQAPESQTLIVAPQQRAMLTIDIPATAASAHLCGLGVFWHGQSASGVRARASAYFELRPNPHFTRRLDDPAMLALLDQIVAQQLVDDPRAISEEDIRRLLFQGKIAYPPAHAAASSPALAQVRPLVGPIGQPCDPKDPNPPQGLSCQIMGWTESDPYIHNAKKGDILLYSTCKEIGAMLRQIGQVYAHEGIMTTDHYQLSHSTVTSERFLLHAGEDGIAEDVLKFGWPGAISQTVKQAVLGGPGPGFEDPMGKGFSGNLVYCPGDSQPVPALVVKPPPEFDAAVRPRLHAAAEEALKIVRRKSHYRPYAYSEAAIALAESGRNAPAAGMLPDRSDWAAGSRPTVSTVFIWAALKDAGITLEGDAPEKKDFAVSSQGVRRANLECSPRPFDGLYCYSEAERKKAGEWLFHDTRNRIFAGLDIAEELVVRLIDVADDVASQIANCFASDDCVPRGDESDAWKDPGEGRTVSPDDFLWWDAPPVGVYGHHERLVYRPSGYRPILEWRPTLGLGSIKARVLYEGKPVPHAQIRLLYDETLEAGATVNADANGEYVFADVPVSPAPYKLEASMEANNLLLSSGIRDVIVAAGQTSEVELVLKAPPDVFREVVVYGTVVIYDDDFPCFKCDGQSDPKSFIQPQQVNPAKRRAQFKFGGKGKLCHDEVRVEIDVDVQLLPDNKTVIATGESRLYEGGDCDTTKNVDTHPFTLRVPADGSGIVEPGLREPNKGWARIELTVLNARQFDAPSVTLTQERGGRLKADAGLSLEFPVGAVAAPARVSLMPATPPAELLDDGYLPLRGFRLEGQGAEGARLPRFARPYTMQLRYDPALLDALGVAESDLAVLYREGDRWVELPPCSGCRMAMARSSLTIAFDRAAEFALVARRVNRVYAPLLTR
jgi:hypothetical protein